MVMGGDKKSEPFIYYKEQTIKAMLITKSMYRLLYPMTVINEASGLTCFRKGSLQNFRNRFMLDKDYFDTSRRIVEITDSALNHYRTRIYDAVQYIQNKITH